MDTQNIPPHASPTTISMHPQATLFPSSEAGDKEISMQEVQLIQDISRYNEVDCKVMMELISYLRNHR